jgi:hypothetical protein
MIQPIRSLIRGKRIIKIFFSAFIKGTSQTFSVLAGDVDRTSSIPLAKYVILLICFGLDRAIFTNKDIYLMWKALEYDWADLHSTV